MLLWFLLTAMDVGFAAVDVRSTPTSPVLKWGSVLLTAYTCPIGAFLYFLGCREPLSRLHERYIAARWRQVLGSTMHCAAVDGLGILAGAVVASCIFLNCWPKRKPSLRHHNQPFNTSRSARFLGIFDKSIQLIVMLIVRGDKILDTRFGRMLAPLCQPGALLFGVRAV